MTRFGLLLALTCAACLEVDAPDDGLDEVAAVADEPALEASDDGLTDDTGPSLIFYGSTYNSNCFCLACVKYCDVDGKTVKSGTCC